jgi:hypothetical protein
MGGVLQINVFQCDGCGEMESTTKVENVYGDPVIEPPKDWSAYDIDLDKLLCPKCTQKKKEEGK